MGPVAEGQLRGFLAIVHRYREVERQLWGYERLHELIKVIQVNEIIPFDDRCLAQYRSISGIKPRIGTQDLKIAAIAKSHNALLLSNNLKDFKRVPGLRVESWIASRKDLAN